MLHIIIVGVSVDIQSNIRLAVTHYILQRLWIKFTLSHPGAECVPKDMRCYCGHMAATKLSILLLHIAHIVLAMHGYLWSPVFIKKDKSAHTVNHHLDLGLGPV